MPKQLTPQQTRDLRRSRHLRERFDANARFVFARDMVADGKRRSAGEDVPRKLRAQLGKKLRLWWEQGLVQMADYVPPESAGTRRLREAEEALAKTPEGDHGTLPREQLALLHEHGHALDDGARALLGLDPLAQGDEPEGDEPELLRVEELGSGWFNVWEPGESEPVKVRGKAALDEYLRARAASE